MANSYKPPGLLIPVSVWIVEWIKVSRCGSVGLTPGDLGFTLAASEGRTLLSLHVSLISVNQRLHFILIPRREEIKSIQNSRFCFVFHSCKGIFVSSSLSFLLFDPLCVFTFIYVFGNLDFMTIITPWVLAFVVLLFAWYYFPNKTGSFCLPYQRACIQGEIVSSITKKVTISIDNTVYLV